MVANCKRKNKLHEINKLIRLYRANECLWNPKSSGFQNVALKENAWQRISQFFKDKLTVDQVKLQILSLRYYFATELLAIKRCQLDGFEFVPRHSYFKELLFLREALQPNDHVNAIEAKDQVSKKINCLAEDSFLLSSSENSIHSEQFDFPSPSTSDEICVANAKSSESLVSLVGEQSLQVSLSSPNISATQLATRAVSGNDCWNHTGNSCNNNNEHNSYGQKRSRSPYPEEYERHSNYSISSEIVRSSYHQRPQTYPPERGPSQSTIDLNHNSYVNPPLPRACGVPRRKVLTGRYTQKARRLYGAEHDIEYSYKNSDRIHPSQKCRTGNDRDYPQNDYRYAKSSKDVCQNKSCEYRNNVTSFEVHAEAQPPVDDSCRCRGKCHSKSNEANFQNKPRDDYNKNNNNTNQLRSQPEDYQPNATYDNNVPSLPPRRPCNNASCPRGERPPQNEEIPKSYDEKVYPERSGVGMSDEAPPPMSEDPYAFAAKKQICTHNRNRVNEDNIIMCGSSRQRKMNRNIDETERPRNDTDTFKHPTEQVQNPSTEDVLEGVSPRPYNKDNAGTPSDRHQKREETEYKANQPDAIEQTYYPENKQQPQQHPVKCKYSSNQQTPVMNNDYIEQDKGSQKYEEYDPNYVRRKRNSHEMSRQEPTEYDPYVKERQRDEVSRSSCRESCFANCSSGNSRKYKENTNIQSGQDDYKRRDDMNYRQGKYRRSNDQNNSGAQTYSKFQTEPDFNEYLVKNQIGQRDYRRGDDEYYWEKKYMSPNYQSCPEDCVRRLDYEEERLKRQQDLNEYPANNQTGQKDYRRGNDEYDREKRYTRPKYRSCPEDCQGRDECERERLKRHQDFNEFPLNNQIGQKDYRRGDNEYDREKRYMSPNCQSYLEEIRESLKREGKEAIPSKYRSDQDYYAARNNEEARPKKYDSSQEEYRKRGDKDSEGRERCEKYNRDREPIPEKYQTYQEEQEQKKYQTDQEDDERQEYCQIKDPLPPKWHTERDEYREIQDEIISDIPGKYQTGQEKESGDDMQDCECPSDEEETAKLPAEEAQDPVTLKKSTPCRCEAAVETDIDMTLRSRTNQPNSVCRCSEDSRETVDKNQEKSIDDKNSKENPQAPGTKSKPEKGKEKKMGKIYSSKPPVIQKNKQLSKSPNPGMKQEQFKQRSVSPAGGKNRLLNRRQKQDDDAVHKFQALGGQTRKFVYAMEEGVNICLDSLAQTYSGYEVYQRVNPKNVNATNSGGGLAILCSLRVPPKIILDKHVAHCIPTQEVEDKNKDSGPGVSRDRAECNESNPFLKLSFNAAKKDVVVLHPPVVGFRASKYSCSMKDSQP